MDDNQKKFKMIFIEEATELLEDLVDSLLELESEPDDKELLNKIFRSFHTIKGSAAMFGLEPISKFTHKIEDAYDLARDGKLIITKELINATLEGRDFIESLLKESTGGPKPDPNIGNKILEQFDYLIGNSEAKSTSIVKEATNGTETNIRQAEITYWIHFHPKDSLFLTGNNPIFLIQELQTLGQCSIISHFNEIPKLDSFATINAYSYWDIFLTTDRHQEAIDDVFMFVEDDADINIEIIDRDESLDLYSLNDKITNTLRQTNDIDKDSIRNLIKKEIADAKIFKAEKQSNAVIKANNINKKIKVDSSRLDTLVDLVGELVIAEASLSHFAIDAKNPLLLQISDQIERISKNLREETLSLRMLPIEIIFNKYRRIVRDLANELGKNIELKITGAETRIDKSMSDKLSDPLVHLIRNSVDHGIESPEERKDKGKPPIGKIYLDARHVGNNVHISIRDDGKGLDKNKIFNKAVEKGLVNQDERKTDQEIYNLIFEPGFSTVDKISSVSGRGVGMDVVKRNIQLIRGTTQIESQMNVGTTISIILPLTLAIIDGIMFKVVDEDYVIPVARANSIIAIEGEVLTQAIEKEHYLYKESVLPLIDLRKLFKIEGERPNIQNIIITTVNNQKFGLVIDEIIGQQQFVIKSLGELYKDIQGVSGATIKGNGTVALILDLQSIYHMKKELMRKLIN